MKKKLFAALIIFLFGTGNSFAYDSDGHKAIEKQAYRFFEDLKTTAGHPDGLTMLTFLKKCGGLSNYPTPFSSYPDFSLERQFAQDKQMYHFMASNDAVLEAAGLPDSASQQHRLLMLSLKDCLQMMYFFFRETELNPKGASEAGRGLYVLIHVVEDSYSPEHTTRDLQTGELVTIKGWNLSRLFWPAAAKAREPDSHLMRLLHNSNHPTGDASWAGNEPGCLSPQATQAAHAVADLLVTLWEADNKPASADQFIEAYFATYFRPLGSSIKGTVFTFSNSKDTIDFNFSGLFRSNTSNYATFGYDRFPRHVLMATSSTSFSKPLGSYGLNYEYFVTPGAADNRHSLFSRIPYSIGGAITEINQGQNGFSNNLNLKAYAKTVFSVPLLPTDLEPYAGAELMPYAGTKHFDAIYGVDGAVNLGNDWGIGKTTTTVRLIIGFEHNFSGIPAKNSLTLKIGFNTWQGRVIKTEIKN